MSAGEPIVMGEPVRASIGRFQLAAFVVGAIGLGGCLAGSFLGSGPQVYRSYLFGYLFWLGLALGSLALTMLHHLVGGGWGVLVRRPLEAGALTIPLMAILFVPIVIGLHQIYIWADPSASAIDEAIRAKRAWLNPNAFLGRAAGYFIFWSILAWLLNRWSLLQDRREDTQPTSAAQYLSGPGLALVFLTSTFAMIDWVMSLEPDWYSTIYGAMLIVGQGLETFAFMIVVAALLVRRPPLAELVRPVWFHDLGNLLLAFVMLWAYMSFSQYLIIWAGNLAEEIPWYLRRTRGGWEYVGIILMACHFFLPFFCLLVRELKRGPEMLMRVALGLLLVHLLDVFWLVAPAFGGQRLHPEDVVRHVEAIRFHVHWLDLAAVVGVGGIWLGMFLWLLKRRPLIPSRDPAIIAALAHGHEPGTVPVLEGGH